MRIATPVQLNPVERRELERLARSKTTSVRLAKRAQIVLLAAADWQNHEIAARVGVGRVQVGRWRDRYAGGLAAIAHDRPRGGRVVQIDAAEMVRVTTQVTPPKATHWSSAPWANTWA